MTMFDKMREGPSFRATPENIAKLAEQFGHPEAKTIAEIVRRLSEKGEKDE